jgi:hypothetical protein
VRRTAALPAEIAGVFNKLPDKVKIIPLYNLAEMALIMAIFSAWAALIVLLSHIGHLLYIVTSEPDRDKTEAL